MSRNTHQRNLERVAVVQWLFHEWWLLARGDVCVVCLLANLALQEFFQMINFHFTGTTEQQPTRNLHSYAQAFAVIFPPHAITTKFASTCTVNDRLFPCFWPPSRQICQLHYQAPVLHEEFRRLQVFQADRAWHSRTSESNVNFAMFELTPRLLPTFRAWLV